MIIHQKDPMIAEALKNSNYPHILDKKGFVKDGKAEGMIMATLLAKLTGRKYIGFIDADNYFPGAVNEYVKIYSSGFALGKSDYSMVRIHWHSKPKIIDSNIFFAKYGRTSIVTNYFLNKILSQYTGFETEVIKTGNAGEDAMTMDLALSLDYASGYAVEPYHLIYIMDKYGGIAQSLKKDIIREHIEVFQIESRNPHLHAEKGEEHVNDMIKAALQVIYHSDVTHKNIKTEIVNDLKKRKLISKKEEIGKPTYYPALNKVDIKKFSESLNSHEELHYIKEYAQLKN